MTSVNIFTAEMEYDEEDPAGYNAAVSNVGKQAGGDELAVKLFDVPAGQSLCPYHYEYVEEWLLVLEGEVVVRPEAVGICGSDFHFFAGELHEAVGATLPRVQGHEVAATIDAAGPGCDDALRPGVRVALWPLTPCGDCYPCRIGRGHDLRLADRPQLRLG